MEIELTEEQAAAYLRGDSVEVKKPMVPWEPTNLPQNENDNIVTIRRAVLRAYVREFGGDWVTDWDDREQRKYSVLPHDNGMYGLLEAWYRPPEVLMSEECARGLVEKLKTGEVVL
tara:strand:- start:5 stop:352 length:348 start_codon:yes stop_codon:yes gene_type:complete